MIMRFWRWLFGGCEHKWVTTREVQVVESETATLPPGVIVILRCEKCGMVRGQKVIGRRA